MKRAAKVTAVLALICLVLGLGLSAVSLLLGARGGNRVMGVVKKRRFSPN